MKMSQIIELYNNKLDAAKAAGYDGTEKNRKGFRNKAEGIEKLEQLHLNVTAWLDATDVKAEPENAQRLHHQIQYIDVIRANHKYSLYVQYIAERFGAELFNPDSTSDKTRAVRHLTRLAEQSDMSFQKTAMIVRDLYLELVETNPLVKNQVIIK